jgi:integrase
VITAAHACDRALGLLVEVVAQTGCRPSQAVRLEAGDLDVTDAAAPKLWMPRSGKGHTSKRARKMQERVPVPVTAALAAPFGEAAKGDGRRTKACCCASGEPWGARAHDHYGDLFAAAVTAAGLDPQTVTLYALRHSGISRALIRGIPLTITADLADTSEREIRKHYAKLISHHADSLARRALLEIEPPAAGSNVVPITRKG